VTAVDSTPSPPVVLHRPKRSARQTVAGYVALTKPRIIELLLVTTVPTMVLAADGIPSLALVTATLLGGALAAGSANTLNCYLDRDIDQVMHRTERRPLATGLIRPREALVFGVTLGVLAVGWLWVTTGALPALLALLAIAFYVAVYTMGLKRRTAQNIVWGGAAGCMPVLIGWSAVTGSVSWAPVVLFAVIFFWTPPHYWPLSMRFRDDYAAAGVPMLPVVAGPVSVARQVVAYTWAMVGASLVLWPVAGTSPVYPSVAAVLGAAFLRETYRLRRLAGRGRPVEGAAMRVFHGSITYLTLLFVAVGLDPLLPL